MAEPPKSNVRNDRGTSTRPAFAGRETVHLDGVVDAPTSIDTLGFAPYVSAVATYLRAERTQPPFTLSIEGSWGSGKSSFLKQLRQELGAEARVIEFNAWRHDKQEALWAAFALDFIEQLERTSDWRSRLAARAALLNKRFSWKRAAPRLLQAAMLLVVLIVAVMVAVRLVQAPGGLESLITAVAPASNASVLGGILRRLVAGGGIVGLLAAGGVFVKKVAEIVGNPLKLELRRYLSEPDYIGHVAFAEQFHRDFAFIVDAYARRGRVYVFIDDLDRCEVPKAAELVQAMHVLMASESKQLIFVLAIDRDIVAAALAAKYEALIPYLAAMHSTDALASVGGDAAAALRKARVGLDYGHDFLEKLIQLPFRVPEPAPQNVDRLLDSLDFAAATREAPEESAVPRSVMEVVDGADSLRVRNIVTTLASALEYNPRRIKQFVSMLRLQAFIAGATGLIAESDASEEVRDLITLEQLGKFVAISLRWPRLVADIEKDRGLLARLQQHAWTSVVNPDPLLARWANEDALIDFLRLGADSTRNDEAEIGRYRLDTVQVNTLLRVSPPRAPETWADEPLSMALERDLPISPPLTFRSRGERQANAPSADAAASGEFARQSSVPPAAKRNPNPRDLER
ncbi:MAG: family P-loop domain protein [Gemmatimonadetes bacterium]|nr:family P-loop domain protein [Gemmatimonadota bacterium]